MSQKNPVYEPPPPSCFTCHAPDTLRQIDEQILASFQIRVCTACKHKNAAQWKVITTSSAKTRYLVSDNVLKQLPFMEKANPRNPHFRPMKLYLTYHVEEAALAIWETLENIDQEIVRKAKRKQARKELPGYGAKRLKKTLVRPKKRGALEAPEKINLSGGSSSSSSSSSGPSSSFHLVPTGKFARNGLVSGAGPIIQDRVKLASAHVHKFGPLIWNEKSDEHEKRCPCGFVQEVELM